MGTRDSSLTRVQPVFDALIDQARTGGAWLAGLCEMAHQTRPQSAPIPDVGQLDPAETPTLRTARVGRVFERVIPPPERFLRWLLEHPQAMQVTDDVTFGASDPGNQDSRRKLFSADTKLSAEATSEGVAKLLALGPQGSRHAWWAFEGFTHIDCCLITERLVLFIEGKRTDTVSASTRWFKQRSQLWRNVEAAEQFAGSKQFGVLLAVEMAADGSKALAAADTTLDGSFPHRSPDERADLSRHLLGFVTWPAVVKKFSLPAECLIERV